MKLRFATNLYDVVCFSMGGGGTSTQTTTQELSPEQRKLIEPVIPIAQGMLNKPPEMFPGSGISGFSPLQQMAQQMTMGAAQNMLPFTQAMPQQLMNLQNAWGSTANTAGQQGAQGQNQLNSILAAMGGTAAQIPGQVQGQTNNALGAIAGQAGNIAGGAQNTSNQVTGAINQGNANTQPGLNFLTGGAVLDPNSNPALESAIRGATRPAIENFQNNIMPSIASEAVSAGGFGGSRQGIAEGLAAQGLTRQVGDIASSMQNQNYQAGLGAMTSGLNTAVGQQGQNLQAMLGSGNLTNQAASQIMNSILAGGQLQQSGTLGANQLQQGALGQMMQGNLGGQNAAQNWLQQQQAGLSGAGNLLGQSGNILQQGLLPAQLTEAVGTQQQAMQQALLTEQVQRYVNEQMLPFAVAQDVAAMAFGMPGGTTKTATTGSSGGGAGSMLQSGLGAMAALPALFSKSDRKLKENIKAIERLFDGLMMYSYNFIGEKLVRFGLMADEVLKLYPLAVYDTDEYMMVRYDLVPSWHMRAKRG